MPEQFRIVVTGDTGVDTYTETVKDYVFGRVHKKNGAYDIEAPSGAAFAATAIEALLDDSTIQITHLKPKDSRNGCCSTSPMRMLVELSYFPDVHSAEKSPSIFRVQQVRPLYQMEPVLDEKAFFALQLDDQAKTAPDEYAKDTGLLVIHDGNGSWRAYPPGHTPEGMTGLNDHSIDAMQLVKAVLKIDPNGRQSGVHCWPRILVNITHDLPDVELNKDGELTFPKSLEFWNTLLECPDRVCVVCSANMLRREGAAISRRLSWEQTVEDVAADLLLFDKLRILSKFKHVVIRFGISGALHIMHHQGKRVADLVFAPFAKSGIYRDPVEEGTVEGQNVALVAALAKVIQDNRAEEDTAAAFVRAMKAGVLALMRAFDRGYTKRETWWAVPEPSKIASKPGEMLIKNLFGSRGGGTSKLDQPSPASAIRHGYDESENKELTQTLGSIRLPSEILAQPPAIRSPGIAPVDWEIIRDEINPNETVNIGRPNKSKIGENFRANVGMAIVLYGHRKVLNRAFNKADESIISILQTPRFSPSSPEEPRDHQTLPSGQLPSLPPLGPRSPKDVEVCHPDPIYAPVVTFGNLTVVERRKSSHFGVFGTS